MKVVPLLMMPPLLLLEEHARFAADQKCCANIMIFGRKGLPGDVFVRASAPSDLFEPIVINRIAVPPALLEPIVSTSLEIIPWILSWLFWPFNSCLKSSSDAVKQEAWSVLLLLLL